MNNNDTNTNNGKIEALAEALAGDFGRTFLETEEIADIIRDAADVDEAIAAAVAANDDEAVADYLAVEVAQNIRDADDVEPTTRIAAAADIAGFRGDWKTDSNLGNFLKEREGIESDDDADVEAVALAIERGEIGGGEFPARAEDLAPLLPEGTTALALTEAGQDWTGSGIPAENCRADAADMLEGQAAETTWRIWAEAMNRDGDDVAVVAEALADAYDRRAELERWALAEGFEGDDILEALADAFAGEFEAGEAEAIEAAEDSAAAVEGERARLAAYYAREEAAARAI